MKTLPLSEVKTKLSGLVNNVTDTDEEIVITTNGRPTAVIVSYDEFESWKETAAIMEDPAFVKEIRAGLKALKRGNARLYTLDELFAEARVPSPQFKLRIPAAVAGTIRGLHPSLKRKIRTALDGLLTDPHAGKPLQRDLSGLWSHRVGRFRIIYRIAAGRTIELVALGPRSTIYEETYRLVRSRPDRPYK